jgi:hypothetical protein
MNRLSLVPCLLAAAACSPVVEDVRLQQSEQIATAFQQTLGGELQAALASGGPVHAIGVCREVAPTIAAGFSEDSGARVSRTALRVRNPDNAADADAALVMARFADALARGEEPSSHFELREDGSARFMRAIVLQPMCALCHGSDVPPEVSRAVAESYPQDAATGFAVGELRGAFLIDWPGAQ